MISVSDQKISERTPRTFSRGRRDAVRAVEALPQRVERAGADVAVDDAERADRECGEIPAPGSAVRVMGDRRTAGL